MGTERRQLRKLSDRVLGYAAPERPLEPVDRPIGIAGPDSHDGPKDVGLGQRRIILRGIPALDPHPRPNQRLRLGVPALERSKVCVVGQALAEVRANTRLRGIHHGLGVRIERVGFDQTPDIAT